MTKKYWINRFPICAMVYKEAAELLGYDKEESKSLGLTRAIFFAAARNGFKGAGAKNYKDKGGYKSVRKEQQIALKGYDVDSLEVLNFAGIGSYVVHKKDGSVRGFIGGKPIEPTNYDNQIKDKLIRASSEMVYLKLKVTILKKLADLKPYELNSGAIFKIYKDLRDEVRSSEFTEISKEDTDVRISTETDIDTSKNNRSKVVAS